MLSMKYTIETTRSVYSKNRSNNKDGNWNGNYAKLKMGIVNESIPISPQIEVW